MSEMKVRSIEIKQEMRLCLGYRQTPQRGQQKELSTNHIEIGEDQHRQHRQHRQQRLATMANKS